VYVFVEYSADLLSVVLSIYMYGSGANIQLPEAGEVLVCNSSTTAEDVSYSLIYFITCVQCVSKNALTLKQYGSKLH